MALQHILAVPSQSILDCSQFGDLLRRRAAEHHLKSMRLEVSGTLAAVEQKFGAKFDRRVQRFFEPLVICACSSSGFALV